MDEDDNEFWRLETVKTKTGLSRSELYRRISIGEFPRARHYPGTNKSFWLSGEVRRWQAAILAAVDEFEGMFA
jgi:predicted DNA-binding transcriptional regulator AlpA